MTFRIGTGTPAGVAFGSALLGGLAFGANVLYRAVTTPVDRPGTLTPNVSISGRNRVFASTLTDPDGIRGVSASTITARSDGQVSQITWTRRDANTFVHTQSRRNTRWNSGTMSVTYTDGNGVETTLTANWSV